MRNKLSLLAFTALASSIGALAPAFAQTAAAPSAGSEPGTISLDQITVTATRGDKQALDVPGTVSVISRQELDERIVRDTQDLVRYQPGVTVNRNTGGTDPFANYGGFNIRGVGGNRVQMQVDGARVIERITDGNRDFVDLPFLKSVEIVRGPGSVLWGADALAGIVAYRTLDPSDLLKADKPYAARVSTSYDSLDHAFSKTAIAAYRFSPQLEAIIGLNHKSANEAKYSRARADGGRWGCPIPGARFLPCDELNPLDLSVWNAFAKVVFKPTTDHTFKLTGEYFYSDTDVNQLYDYNVVSSTGIRNGDYNRNQVKSRKRIALEHDWEVGAPFLDSLRWQASYSPQRRVFVSNRYQSLANGQPRFTRGLLDYTEEFSQLDIQAKSSFDLGPTKHRLTYGFQGDITRTDYERRDDVRNLVTGVNTTTIAGGFNFANATTKRYDFYLQDEIELLGGRWTITPGVRYANYNIDPRIGQGYVIVPGKEPRELESHRFVPQIGTVFKLDETYSLYARYAEGFKMPTAQQLYTSLPFGTSTLIPNPDLKPEKAKSYEAGVRGRFADGWFSLGVFHSDYKDFIQSNAQIPGTTNYTSRNLSGVQISGIEAAAEWRFQERWVANLSVSYQYAKQQLEPGAAKTPYNSISPLTAVTGIKYLMPEYRLEAEVIGTFAAGVTRASAPTIFKPGGYAIFDAYLNWKPTDYITVRGGVQNIFDRRYFPNVYDYNKVPDSAAVAANNPLELQTGAGRTVKLAASVDF